MHKKIYLLVFFLGFIFAQHTHDHDDYIRCAADELEQELQLTNPEFIAKRDAEILKAQELIKENPDEAVAGFLGLVRGKEPAA